MRSLAQYAMKGRRQAILVAFICGLVPIVNLISPAIVGLACLRHGLRDSLPVLAWAVLPLLGWAVAGDVTPLVLMLGVTGLATLLRSSSWQVTLVAAIAVGVLAELSLTLRPLFLDTMMEQVELYFAQSNGGQELPAQEMQRFLVSLFGAMHMFMAICLLMLARWWQAVLYNPGGFQQEFHSLRLPPRIAVTLTVLFLLASFGAPVLAGWIMYFLMPLFFAGLALVHGLVGLKKLSRVWLVVFYVVLLNPLMAQLLTAAALIDSWYDFRAKVKPAKDKDSGLN